MKIEIAIVVDAGEPFVKGTYNLEGDGCLALSCFSVLQLLALSTANRHYPNTRAITKECEPAEEQQEALLKFACDCVKPGVDYFLQVFNYTRECKPSEQPDCSTHHLFVRLFKPAPCDIDQLRHLPCLASLVLSNSFPHI